MPEPAAGPPFRRVAVVGLGLIGGSVARAVRRVWPQTRLLGLDRPVAAEEAVRRGVVDERRDAIGDLADADLVVLATPVLDIVDQIRAAAAAGLAAPITDVGSTKRRVMQAAAEAGLSSFVGGHPLAGAERGGLDHARADLFDGRTWLLVCDREHDPALVEVEQFVTGLGAVPRMIDAVAHDRVMAYVSHVPQLLSSALMAASGDALGAAGLAASGRAFAEMTRLASSPAGVWRDIVSTNTDFITEALQAIVADLPSTPAALSSREVLDRLFDRARTWRDCLTGGAAPLH